MQSQTAFRSIAMTRSKFSSLHWVVSENLPSIPALLKAQSSRPVSLDGLIDHHLDLSRNRNVGGQTARFAASFLDHLDRVFRTFRHVVSDHDLRAFFRQPQRRRLPDS